MNLKISVQVLSRAGAQWCSPSGYLFFATQKCVWTLEASESRSRRRFLAPCSGALLLSLAAPPVPPPAPPTPVLDVLQSSRSGSSQGHVIDLAFVFLFKFGKAQARWPPLCAMPRHALCWRCHTHHRPLLQAPVPS